MEIGFKCGAKDGAARVGEFKVSNGSFATPAFMPVGTRGSVRGVDVERLSETGAQIMLVNTYHLWVRPGEEVIAQAGGIHKFAGWNGPILSDSGGYQIFSLADIRKINEEGVEFRSHIDGAKLFLTPEKAVQIQERLGVDIAMVLDECPAGGISKEAVKASLDLTLRWAKRSLDARSRRDMALFGITQGGIFEDLRRCSIDGLRKLGFDGYAIGGLSVGEPLPEMYKVLDYHVKDLPEDKIRYLMGVGTPRDIVEAVKHGVDLFDCVIPTRSGRFARAFVTGERPYINLRNAEFTGDSDPIDRQCRCLACRNYSCSYINHLFKVGEMLGPVLLSIHNLTHYFNLMSGIRTRIKEGSFTAYYKDMVKQWNDVKKV